MADENERAVPRAAWRETLREVIFEADTSAGKNFDVALLWAILMSIGAVMLESVADFQLRYGTALRVAEWSFTIAFTIAGCAILMSEEDLLSEGLSRTAEFAVDYETLARCFDRERQLPFLLGGGTPTEVPIDSLQIKTDLAMAQYEQGISTSRGQSYVAIIEFRGVEPNKTAVKAYAISSDWLDKHWKTIKGCATAIRPG